MRPPILTRKVLKLLAPAGIEQSVRERKSAVEIVRFMVASCPHEPQSHITTDFRARDNRHTKITLGGASSELEVEGGIAEPGHLAGKVLPRNLTQDGVGNAIGVRSALLTERFVWVTVLSVSMIE